MCVCVCVGGDDEAIDGAVGDRRWGVVGSSVCRGMAPEISCFGILQEGGR